jgi:hypothetical protein
MITRLFTRSTPKAASQERADGAEVRSGLTSPADWLLGLFGATPAASGITITARAALSVPAVRAALELISGTVGTLPVKVIGDAAGGGKEAVTDHPALPLVHRDANPWTAAGAFRTQLTLDALFHGGGYGLAVRDGAGTVREIHRLDPQVEEGYIVLPFYFMPGDNLDARTIKSGFPYTTYADEGLIFTTPGNVTDYRAIEAFLRDLCELYQVREMAFDPHYANMLMTDLQEDGYPVVAFRQGWVTMGPAIRELERAILAGKFQHGGHPVLRWNFANIAIQDDGKGNKSFNKAKASEKIDGAVAAAMAVARAATGEDHSFIYDDVEARPSGFLVW